jgi:hypothetical protein
MVKMKQKGACAIFAKLLSNNVFIQLVLISDVL